MRWASALPKTSARPARIASTRLKPVTIGSAAEAQRHGIAAIYQEPLLFPDLNVAENIFISHQGRGAVNNWRRMFRDAEGILSTLGVTLDVRSPARGLTLAECHRLIPSYNVGALVDARQAAGDAVVEQFDVQRSAARSIVVDAIASTAASRLQSQGHIPGQRFRNVNVAVLLRSLRPR